MRTPAAAFCCWSIVGLVPLYTFVVLLRNKMCFSAIASFAGGTIIGLIGLVGLILNSNSTQFYSRFVGKFSYEQQIWLKRRESLWVPLLLTPCLFSVQQFAEGVVWLQIREDSSPQAFGYTFAFFA
jgi:hypothetical protein